jgi:FkbM family methyltransferase
MISMRPETNDVFIHQCVMVGNEYELPERFSPAGAVLDIGAHIGCFSLLAAQRGCRNLLAFEPDLQNHALAARNLQAWITYGAIRLTRAAVWRSDSNDDRLVHQGYPFDGRWENTGGVVVRVDPGSAEALPKIGLDEILLDATHGGAGRVSLIKIDCEGSEWPILLTSRRLDLVDEIRGEFHERGTDWSEEASFEIGGRRVFTADLLVSHLSDQGFEVTLRRNAECRGLGLFFAHRKCFPRDAEFTKRLRAGISDAGLSRFYPGPG